MFRGEVQEENGQASFVSAALRVPLAGRLRAALVDHDAPGEMTLGVRSEHVLVSIGARPDAIEARVVLVEPVGSDMFVNLAIGDARCVARTEPRSDVEEGQTVWLTFDRERLHLFDPSGRNVLAAHSAVAAA
ncbi:MAG: TOBE domain-containing protein [Chloroflexi bacterium]|nr:TOBE domain-containing protein [Chloroflexota bacterium]